MVILYNDSTCHFFTCVDHDWLNFPSDHDEADEADEQ